MASEHSKRSYIHPRPQRKALVVSSDAVTFLNSMVIRQQHIILWLLGLLALFGSAFLCSYIIKRDIDLYFGKDNGLVFLLLTRMAASAVFFFIIAGFRLRFLIVGFFVGFVSYLLYVLFGGDIVYRSPYFDQLIVSALIVISGAISFAFSRSNVDVSS
jgi:hypothetical protein